MQRLLVLFCSLTATSAFAPSAAKRAATQLAYSPSAAADTLFAAQTAAMEKIQAALPLEAKDYPASLGLDAFSTSDGGTGSMASFEAAEPCGRHPSTRVEESRPSVDALRGKTPIRSRKDANPSTRVEECRHRRRARPTSRG